MFTNIQAPQLRHQRATSEYIKPPVTEELNTTSEKTKERSKSCFTTLFTAASSDPIDIPGSKTRSERSYKKLEACCKKIESPPASIESDIRTLDGKTIRDSISTIDDEDLIFQMDDL